MRVTTRPADAASAPWSDEDIAALAFRCHANGATERQTEALMRALDARRVRSLTRYTERWSDAELLGHIAAAESAVQMTGRRGDLIRVRGTARWPWRTSTSQPMGGAVG